MVQAKKSLKDHLLLGIPVKDKEHESRGPGWLKSSGDYLTVLALFQEVKDEQSTSKDFQYKELHIC